jgi:REP element-mobilizing transposase RayT
MSGYHCGNAPRFAETRVPHASVLRVGVLVMPKGLKRYYGRGDLHFLTSSCYRRLPLLKTRRARNLFVHALGKIRERYKFLLVGYVVMPNHLHLLISECPPTGEGPTILCAKKGPVVQKIKNDRTGQGDDRFSRRRSRVVFRPFLLQRMLSC